MGSLLDDTNIVYLSCTPYLDPLGVNLTATQELLLQSHRILSDYDSSPSVTGGGPIQIVPAVASDWAGRFKLEARGGFSVETIFEANKTITTLTITLPVAKNLN